AGREVAECIQLALEYAPAPPLAAGTPDSAAPEIVAAVRSRGASLRKERERLVAEAARRLRAAAADSQPAASL
ncbi:MAG TPA: hypothetical protein VEC58_09700, partial [Roseiarcus sp.]|nr:hypothetical protein [Roseiarcus sp.]